MDSEQYQFGWQEREAEEEFSNSWAPESSTNNTNDNFKARPHTASPAQLLLLQLSLCRELTSEEHPSLLGPWACHP